MAKRAPKVGIPCPKCGARSSRIYKTLRLPDAVERRRKCLRCRAKSVTLEQVVRES